MRAVSFDISVDFFEAMDEVEDFAPSIGTAGGFAKMGATAKGTVFVNETVAVSGIEHGAGAIGFFG
jgi:hypothetical protein